MVGLVLVLLAAVTACGTGPDGGGDGRSLTVFAAASLTDGFAEVGDAFEAANPGTSVVFSFGPSSGLAFQLSEGAPADVVATASTVTMDALAAADTLGGDPVPFATNALEIAVPPGNPAGVGELADLAQDDLAVALCAEKVPCGAFARQAFDRAGVEPSVDTDEQDVRALLTKVEAGEVDAGVIYRTDVVAAGDRVEGIEVPDAVNVVATYPVAVTRRAGDPATARAFIDFLRSDEGQALLVDAGFGPP